MTDKELEDKRGYYFTLQAHYRRLANKAWRDWANVVNEQIRRDEIRRAN